MIGATWNDVNVEIIKSGLKKAGIYPFNRHVIPEEKCHPESLKRWREQQALEDRNIVVADNGTSNIDVITSNGAQSTDDDKTVENPTSKIFDAATSISKLSFEELLLNTVKHTNNSLSVTERKKVAAGAEVVTSEAVLDRLTVENRVKESKAKETQQRKERGMQKEKERDVKMPHS
ncbi:hypothetical protein JTB14_011731 [Gonioctena quinquepunctata]|nr:hypothetical protein JTB14_011731 [Gonioctena quinquepunctata]